MEKINYLLHAFSNQLLTFYLVWIVFHIICYLLGVLPLHFFSKSVGKLESPRVKYHLTAYYLKPAYRLLFFSLVTFLPIIGWIITTKQIKISVTDKKVEKHSRTLYHDTSKGHFDAQNNFVRIQQEETITWTDFIFEFVENKNFLKYYEEKRSTRY